MPRLDIQDQMWDTVYIPTVEEMKEMAKTNLEYTADYNGFIKMVNPRKHPVMVYLKYKNIVFCTCGAVFETVGYRCVCPKCERNLNDEICYTVRHSGYPTKYAEHINLHVKENKLRIFFSELQIGMTKNLKLYYKQKLNRIYIFNKDTGRGYRFCKTDKDKKFRISGVKRDICNTLEPEDFKNVINQYNNIVPEYPIKFPEEMTKLGGVYGLDYSQMIWACWTYPQIALVSHVNYFLFVAVCRRVVENKIKITATAPYAIMEQAFGFKVPRPAVKDIEKLDLQRIAHMVSDKTDRFVLDVVSTLGVEKTFRELNEIHRIAISSWFKGNLEYFQSLSENWFEKTLKLSKIVYDISRDSTRFVRPYYVEDSIRMMRLMDIHEDLTIMSAQEIELFHDRLMVQYKVKKNELLLNKFNETIESYRHLEYANDNYKIIVPTNMEDLVEEGRAMGHCVGTYIESVAEGRSLILFLRDSNNNRVATIELRVDKNIGYRLEQVKARFNKMAEDDAQLFVLDWCGEFDIICRTCYDITVVYSKKIEQYA